MIRKLLFLLLLTPALALAQRPTDDSTKLTAPPTVNSAVPSSWYAKGGSYSNMQVGFQNTLLNKWVQLVTGYQFNHYTGTSTQAQIDGKAPASGSNKYINNSQSPQSASFNITQTGSIGDSTKAAFLYVVGTSISNHTLVTDYFLPDSGYVQKLAKKLGLSVINNGRSGTTLQQVTAGDNSGYTKRFQVPVYKPGSLYIIELQANDVINDSTVYKPSIWNTQANAMIDAAVAVGWPVGRIALINTAYYNPSNGASYPNIPARHSQYLTQMNNVASSRSVLSYDGYSTFNRTYLKADSLHPSDIGNTQIAVALYNYLTTHGISAISTSSNIFKDYSSALINGNLNTTQDVNVGHNLNVLNTARSPIYTFGGQTNANSPVVYATGSGSTVNIDSLGTVLMFMHMGGTVNTRFGGIVMNAQSPFAYTANSQSFMRMMAGFAPTSGNAVWDNMLINPIINQTGGASGITRGIHIQPTLTAFADWRSIQLDNTAGYAMYQSSTSAKNIFAAKTRFGSTVDAVNTVDVTGTLGVSSIANGTGALAFLSTPTAGGGTIQYRTPAQVLSDIGAASASSVPTAANPTGTAGVTPVNGSAPTYMRSDAAPKVDSNAFRTVANSLTLAQLQTKFNLYWLKIDTTSTIASKSYVNKFALKSDLPTNYITTNTTQTSLTGDKTTTGLWTVGKLVSTGQIYSSGNFIGLGSAAWTDTHFINTGWYTGKDYAEITGTSPYVSLIDGITNDTWKTSSRYVLAITNYKYYFTHNGSDIASINPITPTDSIDLITKSYADGKYAPALPNTITSSSVTLAPGYYTFTGTTATWSMPTIVSSTKGYFYVVNNGSGNIAIGTQTGEFFNQGGNLYSTIFISPGQVYTFYNNGVQFITVQQSIVTPLRLTASGNGSSTTISIAHGIANISSSSIVNVTPINAASAGISYVTSDATNINIVYTIAPASGTNNLSYNVTIKP